MRPAVRVAAAAVAAVTCIHAFVWLALREEVTAPAVPDRFQSMSFAPYGRDTNPDKGEATTEAQIRSDVEAVAPYTRAVRTYASTGNLDLVTKIAAEKGLKTTIGAWLDEDEDRNAREIANAIDVARKNSNVLGIVVGNESILRAERTPQQLIDTIRKVKSQTNVPVTTGETWDVWLDHPELVSAVDYIAAHILPYWEGVPADQVVDRTIGIYDRLRAAYPGKRIVIAEFGWPSAGYNRDGAVPGELEQAKVIRDFAARADALGIEYNLIEAFDAPWKSFEGSVGQYWGMLDADRELKFPLSGPLTPATYTATAAIALLLGIAFSLPVFRFARLTMTQAMVMIGAANLVGAWIATVTDHWLTHYVVGGNKVTFIVSLVLLVPLVVVMLYRIEELATIAFGRSPRRLLRAAGSAVAPTRTPKVSIHIPAYKEPPEMLKQTLDSVARLNWPNFECLVIINNTPDPAFWEPIEEHCRTLGERFKFINLPKVAGFKAGALREAMLQTAPDAEIIGVIDADYVVDPNWLMDLVPTFEDPTVGIVQAPQDHRDANRSLLHEAMNTEYAGFFDIGMVQRNEHDAIVVHGTMCLMRRAAMVEAGDWSSDDDLRGHRSRPVHRRARLEEPLHQHPLRLGPAAGRLRLVQEAAPPLGLWRHADHQEALAPHAAERRHPPLPGAAPRVQHRLGLVARLGEHRRAGGDPVAALGALRARLRHRRAAAHPHRADPVLLRHLPAALHRALSAARGDHAGAHARRRLRGDGGAVHRGQGGL